jgi:thymidylate synthase (FAD)
VKVLDHGYVNLVETWGSDQAIIEAARMSTDKGFLGWGPLVTPEPCESCDGQGETDDRGFALRGQPFFCTKTCERCGGDKMRRKPGDEKLLRYLYTNTPPHTSPFEFGGMIIEVQAPIFVFREWHRHRTQSYNEMSARYTPLPDLNYIPTVERVMINASTTNKQAGTVAGAAAMTIETAEAFRLELANEYRRQQDFYERSLAAGVPKELARVDLPVGRYSRMRASANLLNWLKFLTLRMDKNAQYEIRMYANVVGELVAEKFPRTWALFGERAGG